MTAAFLAAVLVTALQAAGVTDRCTAPASGVRLDHVPIVVEDLAATSARFGDELGLSLKSGRPHENGLVNAHVRFKDGSELELMSVGEPSDARRGGMAKNAR